MDSTKNEETKLAVKLELITKILNLIGKIAIVWIISHYVYLSIKSLSGTTTIASIVVSFFMERTVTENLSYGANLCLIICWYL